MIRFQKVSGAGLAAEASALLSASWTAPSLRYTPEYVGWQLSFPGPNPAPAVAAFLEGRLVGFAGSTHRRLRHRTRALDALVVSFVAVHPDFRCRGIAAGLYRELLVAIRPLGMPVVTFAQAGSAGQRAIERAYPANGFKLQSLGSYPGYMCASKPAPPEWRPGEIPELPRIAASRSHHGAALWSDPDAAQIEHYARDPRTRRLLMCGGAAAFVVPLEYIMQGGTNTVIALDAAWIDREAPAALHGFASAALSLYPGAGAILNAPSLGGFDPAGLRSAGFRQVAPGFHGYFATPPRMEGIEELEYTNLEII